MATQPQENIVKTAVELFVKYGIRSVSIDDICKAIGISKKTFYVSFQTKDDLVDELLRINLHRMEERTAKWILVEDLHEGLRMFAEHLEDNRQDVRCIPQLVYDLQKYYPQQFSKYQRNVFDFQVKQMTHMLERGKKEGLIRPELDVTLNSILLANIHGDTIRNGESIENSGISLAQYLHNAMEIIFRGLLTDEGLKYFRKS